MKKILKALDEYQMYVTKIEVIKQQIAHIDELMGVGVDGIDYSKTSTSKGTSDTVGEIVSKKDAKLKELEKEKRMLETKKDLIDASFKVLTPKEEEAMRKHYEYGHTWVDIADDMNMTYAGIRTLRYRSLKKMAEIYK